MVCRYLLHRLQKNHSKSAWSVVLHILLTVLLEDGSDICFFLVLRKLPWCPWSFKDNWEWVALRADSSPSTHRCIRLLGHVYPVCLNILLSQGEIFLAPDFRFWDQKFLKASLICKDQGKEGYEYLSLFRVLSHQFPLLHLAVSPHFSWFSFCCWYPCWSPSYCPPCSSPELSPGELWLS